MAGDRYYIRDQHAVYFITSTVVYWVDIFTRREYRDIIVDSLNYCVKHKGLVINGWVIMSNHIHLLARSEDEAGMSGFLRDFKGFTSRKLITELQTIPESRREWLLDKFAFEARRSGRAKNFKIWKDDNHAVEMTGHDSLDRLAYIHENPVRAGLVDEPDHYVYSSAREYAGRKGLVEIEKI